MGGIDAYGVDPSKEAVSRADKSVSCMVGTADSLPFENGFFNVVILGFCMYLIDIQTLSKVVSEVDRVLKDRGFLIITDFDVKIPRKREYKHYEGVYSLKCDHAKIFTAFPQFSLVEKRSYSHMDGYNFHTDPKERICTSVLYKDFENAYAYEQDSL